ncbi:MAG: hypothetical protein EB114_02420 [Betaproteobacteria bacterium]|nr:hypothetical protein [Betaproteobacteria bacterium]
MDTPVALSQVVIRPMQPRRLCCRVGSGGGLSNAQERKRMMQSERFALLSLGALVSAMGTFPLMWLVAPIFASVVFGHFTLSRLESSAAKLSANDPSGFKSIGINHE